MTSTVLTTASETSEALIAQIRTCVRASWAVAWATPNRVFTTAMAHIDKFDRMVIGIHGCNTHPECLRAMGQHPARAFIRRNDRAALFHPKLYVFEHADHYTVIVGSHNMTGGAFGANVELSLQTEFPRNDSTVHTLLAWIKEAAHPGSCVTYSTTWITAYEQLYKTAKFKRAEIDAQLENHPNAKEVTARASLPINKTWAQWFDLVQHEKSSTHSLASRLQVLEHATTLFRAGTYAQMNRTDRLRVSGLASKELREQDGVDWNFFGSMKVASALRAGYDSVVVEDPGPLSSALELLPSEGLVTERHWTAYWAALRQIDDGRGLLGRGTATRLASMRRPDTFVTLNNGNQQKLASLLKTSEVALRDGAAYWKTVIQPIQMTDWYTSPPPAPKGSLESRAWRSRAALLDALVYG